MGFLQDEHTDAALPDAAADGEGQAVLQNRFVIREGGAFGHTGGGKLPPEAFGVHAHAHGGDLERGFEHRVPDEDIAVEGPVVVVRGAGIVRDAVGQRVPDPDQAHGALFARDRVFARLLGECRVAPQKLLRRDKGHVAVHFPLQGGIDGFDQGVHVRQHPHDRGNGLFQGREVPLLGRDDLFPVPLVHEQGVEVIHVVVAPDGVHIGIDPFAGPVAVARQRHALPFGKALHHLGLAGLVLHGKADLALHAGKVVVQPGPRREDHGSGHAVQMQSGGEPALERVLRQLDRLLRLPQIQRGPVARGKNQIGHRETPFCDNVRHA